jgi:ABC-type polar amino acid transport system ATPase subunit
VSITFKNQQVLKDCTWEVKKGERVGLVGEWAWRQHDGSMVAA